MYSSQECRGYFDSSLRHFIRAYYNRVGRVAQSVWRLVTVWTVRGSNHGGGEIFRTCPDQPWGPASLLYSGTGSFLGVKCGQGVTLTPHPLLVTRSRKSRAIPLHPPPPTGRKFTGKSIPGAFGPRA